MRPPTVVAGLALTGISAWAWWRIGNTFRAHLRDFHRYGTPARGSQRGS